MPSNNQQLKIEELQKENKLMRQLATPTGFYEYYFKQLKHHQTNMECFNHVNDLYFEIFGEYRYSSYYSFARTKLWKK